MTTTAKTKAKAKTTTLRLTSAAKMGAARKTKKKQAPERVEQITQELVDAGTNPQAAPVIAEIMAQVPAPLDLDGTSEPPTMADVIGQPAAEAASETKVEPETDPTVEMLIALLTRPEGATVEQMLEASGLTRGGLRTEMNKTVVGKLGYRTTLERIPNSSPARFIYRATK